MRAEDLTAFGYQMLILYPLMRILGHNSLEGHVWYRKGDNFADALLRWLASPTPDNEAALIRKYGGEEAIDEILQVMAGTLPNLFSGGPPGREDTVVNTERAKK